MIVITTEATDHSPVAYGPVGWPPLRLMKMLAVIVIGRAAFPSSPQALVAKLLPKPT